jgi:hypothetical protein
MQNDSPPRSQHFAKLLEYQGSQALVFLQRDNTEKLAIIVQLWSDAHDHQLRAALTFEHDDQAVVAFDSIIDGTIDELIEGTGLAAALNQE